MVDTHRVPVRGGSAVSDDVLICPNCRARVLADWSSCKFCGTALRVERIDAAVHPDDLAAAGDAGVPGGPDAASRDATGGSGPAGPRSPWGNSWSSWAGTADGPAGGEGGSGHGTGSGFGADTDGGAGGPWPARGTAPAATDAPGGGFEATGERGSGDPGSAGFGASDAGGASGPGTIGDAGADFGMPGSAAAPPTGGGWDAPVTDIDDVPVTGWGAPDASATTTGFSDPHGAIGSDFEDAKAARALIPVEDADPTWVPGPAPSVHDDAGVPSPAFGEDTGPSGLDPVSWYPEPGSSVGDDDGSEVFAAAAAETQAPIVDDQGDRFDPDALFRDPEPGAVDAGGSTGEDLFEPPPFGGSAFDPDGLFSDPAGDVIGQDLEPVAPGGEVEVHWQPAAADAWDTPVEPKGKAKRQAVLSRESRLLVGGIIVVLVIFAAALALRNRGDDHPAAWAANVQQMADWVSKTRKVPFRHPVAVTTLDAKSYEAAVAAAGIPDKPTVKAQLADQVAMWRALGAVEGTPTARREVVAAQSPELGAFYDLDNDTLVLRGGTDLATVRRGLAGAMSVALDDQRADLSSLDATGIGEDPRFDVVLGTAALMRTEYVRSTTKSSGGSSGTDAVGVEPLPGAQSLDFLTARRVLRTRLGGPFTQIVRDVQGVAKLNGLAKTPPATSQQVMEPLAYFDGQGALTVPQPVVPEGATMLDEGALGAQTWYLLVAAHLEEAGEVAGALDFAGGWAGDAYVAYRKADGKVCVTDVLRGSDESRTAILAVTLKNWKKSVSGGNIEVTAEGASITISGCDPGPSTDRGLGGQIPMAITVAVTRSNLAAGYYLAGKKIPNGVNGPVFSPEVAWCMGDEVVKFAQPDQFPDLIARKRALYRDLTLGAAARCDSNMANQLFVDRSD